MLGAGAIGLFVAEYGFWAFGFVLLAFQAVLFHRLGKLEIQVAAHETTCKRDRDEMRSRMKDLTVKVERVNAGVARIEGLLAAENKEI